MYIEHNAQNRIKSGTQNKNKKVKYVTAFTEKHSVCHFASYCHFHSAKTLHKWMGLSSKQTDFYIRRLFFHDGTGQSSKKTENVVRTILKTKGPFFTRRLFSDGTAFAIC